MSEELKKGIIKGIITGEREISKEERQEARNKLEKIMRKNGVLKEGQKLPRVE